MHRPNRFLTALCMVTLSCLSVLAPLRAPISHAGGNYSWTGQGDGHSWGDPGNWDLQQVPEAADSATIAGTSSDPTPKVDVGGAVIAGLTIGAGATLRSGSISVSASFSWTGGNISMPVHLLAGSVGSIGSAGIGTSPAKPELIGPDGAIDNAGNLTIGSADLWLNYNGASISNSGTLTLQGARLDAQECCVVVHTLTNTGTVEVNSSLLSSGTSTLQGVAIDNRGTIDVQKDDVLDLQIAPSSFAANAKVTGAGRVKIENTAAVTLKGAVQLDPTATVELGDHGHLAGTGSFSGGGQLNWTGGQIDGDVTVASPSTLSLSGSGTKSLLGRLTNGGSATFSAGTLSFPYGGARFTNLGTFTAAPGVSFTAGGCCVNPVAFHNLGTFTVGPAVSGGPTAVMFSGVRFSGDAGTVTVGSGLILDLRVAPSDFAPSIAVKGAGSIKIENGANLALHGLLRLDPTATLQLTTGGHLSGSGSLGGGGTFDWNDGTVDGVVTVIKGNKLVMEGTAPKALMGRIVNAGSATFSAGTLSFPYGVGAFTNLGTFTATPGVTFSSGSCCVSPVVFQNAGSFAVSGNTGTITFSAMQFRNTGTATLGAVTLQSSSLPYIQAAGSTQLQGGHLAGKGVDVQGGVLQGSGTLDGPVSNEGWIRPAPAGLKLSGDFTQSTNGTLDVTIGGKGHTGHLQVTKSATLSGSLHLQLTNGYVPQAGDTFALLTYAGHTGSFAHVDGLSLNAFALHYNPLSLTLGLNSQTRVQLSVPQATLQTLQPSVLARNGYTLTRQIGQTPMTLTVTDGQGHPLSGYGLKVAVSVETGSGGHDYEASGSLRPHGWASLTPATAAFPANNGPSGSTRTVEIASLSTDAHGVAHFEYIAPEISGIETITVSSLQDSHVVASLTLQVKARDGVTNLQELTFDPNIVLDGASVGHQHNHFGTAALTQALRALAHNYKAVMGKQLPVGDMSLPWGGLFDLGPTASNPSGQYWSTPYGGHRWGTEAAIDLTSRPANAVLESLIRQQGWWDTTASGWTNEGNHYHLTLKGAGQVNMAARPGTASWQSRNYRWLTVPITLQNVGGLDAEAVNVTALATSTNVTILSPDAPIDVAPIAIRQNQTLNVQVEVPAGVTTFTMSAAGVSYAYGRSWPFSTGTFTVTVPA